MVGKGIAAHTEAAEDKIVSQQLPKAFWRRPRLTWCAGIFLRLFFWLGLLDFCLLEDRVLHNQMNGKHLSMILMECDDCRAEWKCLEEQPEERCPE